MKTDELEHLLRGYRSAPKIYQATSYWSSYDKRVLDTIRSMDISELRSGKYPILATFGMGDATYSYTNIPLPKRLFLKSIHKYLINMKSVLPYGLTLSNIQEMAHKHCELTGQCTNSLSIENLEVSIFGNPSGLFEINKHKYTVQFLAYYIRYCFANKHMKFKGDETIVELGSGSGYQTEVMKKLYPDMTILCFDLPAQIYLCEKYLSNTLTGSKITGPHETLEWNDLSKIEKGGVYLFGNWKFPLLKNMKFDAFWNAASFGEMEPDIVKNYLDGISDNATWVYLLQARNGKETSGKTHVNNPITLKDYSRLLPRYALQEEHDAWHAHRRLSESGGYFEGVWKHQ